MFDYRVWRKGADLGKAVRDMRQAKGMTQAELGEKSRVGRKFLWELESGKETLRIDKVLRVLAALELTPLVVMSVIANAIG